MGRRTSCAVVILTLLTPLAGQAATHRASPGTINQVLARATGGDVVVLGPGAYQGIRLSGRQFQPALVLDARAASIEGFEITKVHGLDIRGGAYRLPPPITHPRTKRLVYGSGLRMDDVERVKINGITVQGPGATVGDDRAPFGDGYGVFVLRARDIEVSGSRFLGLKSGVVFGRVDGFRLTANSFVAMRSDGFQGAESRHGLIQDNECHGMRILPADHPDCIQLWSRPTSPPTADIVIRKNHAEGHTQGIGLFNHVRDGVDDGGFDRITIEDNDLAISFPHGIGVADARKSIVRNNSVRTLPDARWRASINLTGDIVRCGNTVAAGAGKPAMKDEPCATAP